MQPKIKKKCVICNEEFEGIKKSKYCSKRCSDASHYLRHKDKYKENARLWEKNNPEKAYEKRKKSLAKFRKENPNRFNELMRLQYKRNPSKQNARTKIGNMIHGRGGYKEHTNLIPNKFCKKCKSTENLEVHHEIYPTKKQEIIQAVTDGKIYYLCRLCHRRRNSHDSMNT